MSLQLPPLAIHAVGTYSNVYGEDTDTLVDLKPVLKQYVKNVPRRLTRFVQLALIGASECAAGRELPEQTGVYFSSCRGDTGVTSQLLDELVRDRHPPAPLNFVNSVSNAACFYVAKVLQLYGRSNFVSNYYEPVVAALTAAQLDLSVTAMPAALVGSVESCSSPLANHRRRLSVSPERSVAEATNWLLVSSKSRPLTSVFPVLGYVNHIGYFDSLEALQDWLEAQTGISEAELWCGQHLPVDVRASIQQSSGIQRCNDYVRQDAYYDSPTVEGILQYLNSGTGKSMLHINADPTGRYTLLHVSRA
ncbi:hypothetical protein [Aurantivibrio plasticivorans]